MRLWELLLEIEADFDLTGAVSSSSKKKRVLVLFETDFPTPPSYIFLLTSWEK